MVAMEDWHEKLSADNANAKFLANLLNDKVQGASCDTSKVQTNMFVFTLDEEITNPKKKKGMSLDNAGLAKRLREEFNIWTMPTFQNDGIRIVTHRDVNTEDMETTANAI